MDDLYKKLHEKVQAKDVDVDNDEDDDTDDKEQDENEIDEDAEERDSKKALGRNNLSGFFLNKRFEIKSNLHSVVT